MKILNPSQSCECGRYNFYIDFYDINQIIVCPSCSRKYYINGRKTDTGDFIISLSRP